MLILPKRSPISRNMCAVELSELNFFLFQIRTFCYRRLLQNCTRLLLLDILTCGKNLWCTVQKRNYQTINFKSDFVEFILYFWKNTISFSISKLLQQTNKLAKNIIQLMQNLLRNGNTIKTSSEETLTPTSHLFSVYGLNTFNLLKF